MILPIDFEPLARLGALGRCVLEPQSGSRGADKPFLFSRSLVMLKDGDSQCTSLLSRNSGSRRGAGVR